MRRIDVVTIGVGSFLLGGGIYVVLRGIGLDNIDAGILSQVALVIGLLVWVGSYVYRAVTKNMTYNQQLKDYEDAVLQKRFEELSPEELTQLQAEIEAEKRSVTTSELAQTDNNSQEVQS
jgi:class 3 adenylate cyclase